MSISDPNYAAGVMHDHPAIAGYHGHITAPGVTEWHYHGDLHRDVGQPDDHTPEAYQRFVAELERCFGHPQSVIGGAVTPAERVGEPPHPMVTPPAQPKPTANDEMRTALRLVQQAGEHIRRARQQIAVGDTMIDVTTGYAREDTDEAASSIRHAIEDMERWTGRSK